MSNRSLNEALRAKADEFYTDRDDIQDEMNNYRDSGQFKNKIVYCNCDDPKYSNFWNYFFQNFDLLELKKLISTHYRNDAQVDDLFKGYSDPAYALEYDGKTEKTTILSGGGGRLPFK